MNNDICFLLLQVYRKYGKEYGEQTNPNITYHFYTPISNNAFIKEIPRGKWTVVTTSCSVTCGSGKSHFEFLIIYTNDC